MRNLTLKAVELKRTDTAWELMIAQNFNHPQEDVWLALTDRRQVVRWGPFAPDRDLDSPGPLCLTPINRPGAEAVSGEVLEVQAQQLLVMQWGRDKLRWSLSSLPGGSACVLRHQFDDGKMASSYAAGWHLCMEGLAGIVAGHDMPSMVGMEASRYGWDALYAEYKERLSGLDE